VQLIVYTCTGNDDAGATGMRLRHRSTLVGCNSRVLSVPGNQMKRRDADAMP
jgi:hypothetical protein